MGKTKIEWTNETWNPVTGCTKISEGCKNCYAERMARRLASRYGYQEYPYHFDVTLHEDKLDQPYHWKKPRMIFVCSMGDLFHADVDFEYILKVWKVMAKNSQHTFQVLTKRPLQMFKFLECMFENYSPLPNVWLGVTAENQETAEGRIPWLLNSPAVVHFVSVEPMLSPINLWKFATREETFGSMYDHRGTYEYYQVATGIKGTVKYHEGIDWVICGGETGYGAREMKAKWAWSLYNQCKDAGVPFFFKKPGDAFRGGELPNIREYPKG